MLGGGRLPADLDEVGGEQRAAALLRRDLRGARRGVHDVLAGRRGLRRPADPRARRRRPRRPRGEGHRGRPPRQATASSSTAPARPTPRRPRPGVGSCATSAGRGDGGRDASGRRSTSRRGRRLDDNLVAVGRRRRPQVACRHCATVLSHRSGGQRRGRRARPGAPRGPGLRGGAAGRRTARELYVDRAVHFRQYCCPGCFTAISTAVVPVDHVDDVTRTSRVLADRRRSREMQLRPRRRARRGTRRSLRRTAAEARAARVRGGGPRAGRARRDVRVRRGARRPHPAPAGRGRSRRRSTTSSRARGRTTCACASAAGRPGWHVSSLVAIGRAELLAVLQRHAEDAGVKLEFGARRRARRSSTPTW